MYVAIKNISKSTIPQIVENPIIMKMDLCFSEAQQGIHLY